MKWLQNNLPGLILLGACGVLVLVSALLAFSWSRPANVGASTGVDDPLISAAPDNELTDLGSLGEYRVVTDRPLFNETRRPVIEVVGADEQETEEVQSSVADAPKVSLTGVVITPEARLVSLTPEEGGEALVFREGLPMRGDYNGWRVSEVSPRSVRLESSDGESLDLRLVVHDSAIRTPPRQAPAQPAQAASESPEVAEVEDDLEEERMSRAEEIRQRIAERREQLRQQAAEKEGAGGGSQQAAPAVSPYQSAIQDMINKRRNDQKKEDDEDD